MPDNTTPVIKPKPAPPEAPSVSHPLNQPATPKETPMLDIAKATAKEQSDVYAMPKEFQHHNRVAGSQLSWSGLVIVAVSFVLLAVIGGGLFLYIFHPGLLSDWSNHVFGSPTAEAPAITDSAAPLSPDVLAETGDAAATSTSTATSTPTMSPQQVYMAYSRGLTDVKTFADYYDLVSQYGSRRRLAEADGQRLVAEATTDADQASVKAIKEKIAILTGDESFQEAVNGDMATLRITSADGKTAGDIGLILENNEWKVGDENWQLPDQTAAVVYKAGDDRDGDGLTDAEEDLLDSDKNSTDSDHDGYSDLKEVLNLYNPAGNNKLVDNPKIKSYLPDDHGFYFLYPATWQRVSDKGFPIFMGPDNHFFQLVLQDNTGGQTLDDYFLQTTGSSAIKDSWRRQSDTWRGLTTEDGLTVYVTDSAQKEFYIFHYNPGDQQILEYPNIFSALVNSLVIKQ